MSREPGRPGADDGTRTSRRTSQRPNCHSPELATNTTREALGQGVGRAGGWGHGRAAVLTGSAERFERVCLSCNSGLVAALHALSLPLGPGGYLTSPLTMSPLSKGLSVGPLM